MVLSEEGVDGRTFIAPFATRPGKWQIVRIPFTQFRPEVFNRAYNSGGDAEIDAVDPIDLNAIERVGIRYEARNQSKDKSTGGAPDWMTELDAPSNNGFELEMEYLKALPKGEETDFVLVSCGGAGLEDGEDRDKLVKVRVYFYLFPSIYSRIRLLLWAIGLTTRRVLCIGETRRRAHATQQRPRVHHRPPRAVARGARR